MSKETSSDNSSPLAGEEGARRAAVGRRGGKRDLLSLAKRMRSAQTDAESKLWSMLRGKRLNGWKFKRQEQIGDYIVDFVNVEKRLIVEADGSQHADDRRCAKRAEHGCVHARSIRGHPPRDDRGGRPLQRGSTSRARVTRSGWR